VAGVVVWEEVKLKIKNWGQPVHNAQFKMYNETAVIGETTVNWVIEKRSRYVICLLLIAIGNCSAGEEYL
jgi:hypothetical protein